MALDCEVVLFMSMVMLRLLVPRFFYGVSIAVLVLIILGRQGSKVCDFSIV